MMCIIWRHLYLMLLLDRNKILGQWNYRSWPEFENRPRLQMIQCRPDPHQKQMDTAPEHKQSQVCVNTRGSLSASRRTTKARSPTLSYRDQAGQSCRRNAKRALRVQRHPTGPFSATGDKGGALGANHSVSAVFTAANIRSRDIKQFQNRPCCT
jgi:hypothetical protein